MKLLMETTNKAELFASLYPLLVVCQNCEMPLFRSESSSRTRTGNIYGTPQSKQSQAPEKWRFFFFETPPKNYTNMPFFLIFFTYSY